MEESLTGSHGSLCGLTLRPIPLHQFPITFRATLVSSLTAVLNLPLTRITMCEDTTTFQRQSSTRGSTECEKGNFGETPHSPCTHACSHKSGSNYLIRLNRMNFLEFKHVDLDVEGTPREIPSKNLVIVFSIVFRRKEDRYIGVKDLGRSRLDLSCFGINITLDKLQDRGIYLRATEALQRLHNWRRRISNPRC
ncbi:hypothetical protein J6590_107774 [Homalodisca vitripennis]|nr:hypothetical protein J6590_107774 [Homalodisca vitripennis]